MSYCLSINEESPLISKKITLLKLNVGTPFWSFIVSAQVDLGSIIGQNSGSNSIRGQNSG